MPAAMLCFECSWRFWQWGGRASDNLGSVVTTYWFAATPPSCEAFVAVAAFVAFEALSAFKLLSE